MNSKPPEIWGPKLWFTLHNTASYYPDNPSPICRQRMKHLILSVPLMTTCEKCSDHATDYIQQHLHILDDIVSSRYSLFKFFVDFHNAVNRRLNKPVMLLEEAWRLYL